MSSSVKQRLRVGLQGVCESGGYSRRMRSLALTVPLVLIVGASIASTAGAAGASRATMSLSNAGKLVTPLDSQQLCDIPRAELVDKLAQLDRDIAQKHRVLAQIEAHRNMVEKEKGDVEGEIDTEEAALKNAKSPQEANAIRATLGRLHKRLDDLGGKSFSLEIRENAINQDIDDLEAQKEPLEEALAALSCP